MTTDANRHVPYLIQCMKHCHGIRTMERSEYQEYFDVLDTCARGTLVDIWKAKDVAGIKIWSEDFLSTHPVPDDEFRRMCFTVAYNSYPMFMDFSSDEWYENHDELLRVLQTLYSTRPAPGHLAWIEDMAIGWTVWFDGVAKRPAGRKPPVLSNTLSEPYPERRLHVLDHIRNLDISACGDDSHLGEPRLSARHRIFPIRDLLPCLCIVEAMKCLADEGGAEDAEARMVIIGELLLCEYVFSKLRDEIVLISDMRLQTDESDLSPETIVKGLDSFLQAGISLLQRGDEASVLDAQDSLNFIYCFCNDLEHLHEIWASSSEEDDVSVQ